MLLAAQSRMSNSEKFIFLEKENFQKYFFLRNILNFILLFAIMIMIWLSTLLTLNCTAYPITVAHLQSLCNVL